MPRWRDYIWVVIELTMRLPPPLRIRPTSEIRLALLSRLSYFGPLLCNGPSLLRRFDAF